MQLTRAADYAVRVMMHLAGLPAGTRTSRSELADAAGCPEQFLSKVLQNLTRSGLVVSHRGNTGGFELPDLHRNASVLEVIEAVEGTINLNVCLTNEQACDRQAWCPAHNVWAGGQEAMKNILRNTTITELAQQIPGPHNPQPIMPRWN
jgi:Rrf2 family protein